MSVLTLGAVTASLMAPPPPGGPDAKAPIVVDGVPISRGHLRRWKDIARRSGSRPAPEFIRKQVAGLLISSRWIRGESRELGLVVTPQDVTQALEEQRDAGFPNAREFRSFLRESGQSRFDIRWRFESDLLSERLRVLATAGATTPDEEQAQLDVYVRAFRRKWSARTACRPPWVIADCGATGRT